ncbi:MAG: hypothetical protein ACXQS4_03850 [Methermicoccaceae archaeon]
MKPDREMLIDRALNGSVLERAVAITALDDSKLVALLRETYIEVVGGAPP